MKAGWLVVLWPLFSNATWAQQPGDISFKLRLTKDSAKYSVDEPIMLELSISSTAVGAYYGTFRSLMPWKGLSVLLQPRSDTFDLRVNSLPLAGSFISTGAMLTSTALIEAGDLTQWYRFQKPGHFRASLRCNRISHVGATGKQSIWLQSNEVEFEVVARDAASDAASLASILYEIDAAKDYSTRTRALHRLDLAQSSAATSQKIRRYLAAASGGFSEYTGMLQHASDVDAIIPVLETALTDLQKGPPRGIADLLACLQTRKLGIADDNPAREALTRRYFEKYVNLFLATLPSRSGSGRAPALFEAWLETLRIRQRPPDLEAEVLGVFPQLDTDQQFEFLSTDWG